MSKELIKYNSDYSAGIIPSVGAIVTFEKIPPTTSAPVNDTSSGKMAYWGDDNDFPGHVIKDIRKDPEIGTMLDKQARLLYSGGLVFGKLDYLDNGEEILKPVSTATRKVVSDWMRKSNINRYLYEGGRDLYTFYNVFPEVVLNVGRTEIVQLCVQAAETCRFEKQNAKGIVENCYINSNFPDDDEINDRTKKLQVIDPYYDAAANLKSRKGTNFIYPLSIPTAGSKYYQLADWNSIRDSGWLAVSQAIPKFAKTFIEKSQILKYHIEISDKFWGLKYEGWDKKSQAEKLTIRDEEIARFVNVTTGVDKSGNSFFTPFLTDSVTGKEYSLWKVKELKDEINDEKFLKYGTASSVFKATSVGLHPALIGAMPNSGMGGAGSNIREAYNLHMLSVRSHQDILLEPLDLVKYYNGWDEEIVFRFRNSFMNTLDKGKETSKTQA